MSFPTPSTRPLRAASLLLGGWLLAASSGWSATTVDTFDVPQATVAGGATATQTGSMLGGARTLAPQSGAQASVGSGKVRLNRPAAGSGLVQALWGGPAASLSGLGGVALNSGGDDAFLLGVASADQAASLTLRVWTDATHSSSVTVAVAASAQPAYYRVAFAAFTGTANFGNVGAVALELDAAAAANTVSVDFLRTTKTSEAEPVARLTDVVLVDVNGDGRAGAGDTLRYFVTVKNTGATAMTNVQIAATTPANTTASGTVAASPVARPTAPTAASMPGDAWHAAFGTTYTRSAAQGLLGGSFLGFPSASIVSFGGGMLGGTVDSTAAGATAVANGHSLQVNADGSLTFIPKAGFTGIFSFQYRIANASGASTTTAQIAVGARPAAQADLVPLVGNIAIQPNATAGVIQNSGGAGLDGGDALQVIKFGKDAGTITTNPGVAGVTAQGGAITVQADGSFTYTPPAGFAGDDSFYYQVDNGFAAPSTAMVTLRATGRVWFVQSGAAVNGDGRLGSPFNSLASFVGSAGYTAAAAGDVVYLYSGTGYSGTYTMKAGQALVGHSVALGSVVTLPAYSTAPLTGTTPSWTSAQITLPVGGGAAAIRGISLAGTTGTIISGSGTGAVTLTDLTVSPSGSAAGFSLTGGTGALNATGVVINSSSSGSVFRIDGGTYAVTMDATSSIKQTGTGAAFAINNHPGGALSFANPIEVTGAPGIALTNNTGATISLTGLLTLSTGANAAFSATGGGTVTATKATSTIVTTTGQALRVVNTTIGAGGLAFRSISSNGAAIAIELANTGSAGGLTVAGNGAAATGGTIQNTSGTAAISLTSTKGVSLAWMDVKNNSGSGIRADGLDSFTLSNCNFLNCDLSGYMDGSRSGFRADNLSGTGTITNCTFKDSKEDQIRIMPTSGTFAVTISGSTIGCTGSRPATGGLGLALVPSGTANATLTITGSTFSNNYSSALLTSGGGSAQQTVNVSGCTFTNNWVGVDLAHDGTGAMTTKVENNTLTGSLSTAVRLGTATTATSAVAVNGVVRGNTIGTTTLDSGSRDGYGIAIDIAGDANARVAVTNNTIQHTDVQGFYGQCRLPLSAGGSLDLTYLSNTVGAPDNNSAAPYGSVYGTLIEARNTSTVRLNISGNASASAGGVPGFRVRLRDTANFGLAGLSGATSDVVAVGTFVANRNLAGSTADATVPATPRPFTPASVALPSNN